MGFGDIYLKCISKLIFYGHCVFFEPLKGRFWHSGGSRGVYLFNQILKLFETNHPKIKIKSGILDFTFFRDDFRRTEKTLSANSTQINFTLENKRIVLIDDVLFTGRSIKAAMSAIDSYGRPKSIELLVLVDRRFKREIPIEANYCGTKIDTFKGDKVKVIWDDKPLNNKVFIES